MRLTSIATMVCASAIVFSAADSHAWQEDYPVINFGMSSSEGEEERRARFGAAMDFLADRLGVELNLYVTGDTASVVEAILSEQIEMVYAGPLGYATAYAVTGGNVVPLISMLDSEGDWGYRSVIVVPTESDIQSFEDLEGRSLAYADPGSTSGYLVPQFYFDQLGINPDEYFSETGFSGGHNNSIFALLQGTYDAAATWQQDEFRGVPGRMIQAGLLDEGAVRVIWESPIIPSAPIGVRGDLPQEMIDDILDAWMALPEEAPEALSAMSDGQAAGLRLVTHEDYLDIVEMRELEQRMRRER